MKILKTKSGFENFARTIYRAVPYSDRYDFTREYSSSSLSILHIRERAFL